MTKTDVFINLKITVTDADDLKFETLWRHLDQFNESLTLEGCFEYEELAITQSGDHDA